MPSPSREISFPFHFGPNGGIAYEDDSVRKVINRIGVLMRTIPGERVMLPNFGSSVYGFLFENNDPVSLAELGVRLQNEIQTWEPNVVIHDLVVSTPNVRTGLVPVSLLFSVTPHQKFFSDIITVAVSATGVVRCVQRRRA